ncbi:MAG: hypothetical protein QG641_1339 [Candidatus Poribacteria bacterium]|nr:hypothetical protein [Candidatus Poribacteria bacterium]
MFMYKPTSPQLSFLEPNIMIPGILPKDDWSHVYEAKVYPRIDEDKFKNLYKDKGGAPNRSIKLLISILIFMAIEKLNWREAEFQFQRRIDWMNATHTAFGEASIDHTTLFKFFQRLESDDTAYQLFKDLTKIFIEECEVSVKKQRVDSFFMFGWLKILSRYGLFKETIRTFLQALRKHNPGLYEKIKGELSRDYLEKEFDLTEKDKAKATRKIKEMAQDLYILKSAFENHNQIEHYESFKTLTQVFGQQCMIKESSEGSREKEEIIEDCEGQIQVSAAAVERDEEIKSSSKSLPQIEIREKPEGEKIISSPHNTDAEYTKKGNQKVVGHKGFVAETCAPENKVQFITDVNLEAATHSDAQETPRIEERLEDNDCKPESLYGDAGFVNGKTILKSEEKGIDLAGPSSGRSQSIENFERKDRPLDIADFEVEIDDASKELKVLLCPNKEKPLDQNRSDKGNHILVHFDKDICTQCPLCTRCPVKIGTHTSTLTVTEEQYAGAARHHQYMESADYRKECGIRAGAESMVNEIANGHGARKSKHKTEARSRLQLIFASIGCNVKRYIRYTVECVQDQVNVQNQLEIVGATV